MQGTDFSSCWWAIATGQANDAGRAESAKAPAAPLRWGLFQDCRCSPDTGWGARRYFILPLLWFPVGRMWFITGEFRDLNHFSNIYSFPSFLLIFFFTFLHTLLSHNPSTCDCVRPVELWLTNVAIQKHVEDAHPEDDRPPQCGSGSNSRLGSSGPRSSHDGSRGNGKANDVHLKSRKKMAASSTSRPAAAIAAGAATGVATTSVVINGSPDDSDSMSDNDEGKANGESQFADCPVDGCQESVVASEMAYHVDLHAALEYQGKPVDDSDVVSKGKDNAKSLAAAPKKANDSRTRAQALSFDGRAQGMSAARSSSVPPVQRRPQRSASRKSTDSSKSVNAVKLSGARESRKVSVSAPPPRDDSRERHRERREHQRNQERGRGRGRVHTGELGLSTLGQNSSSHQTFLSRKPSKTIRSWLAMFSGVDSRKHAPSEEPERARGDRDKEKDKAIIPLVHRHRHSSSAKNGAAKAMEAVSETPKRLGKAELGKFADEDRMPDALAVYLKKEWGVRHEGERTFSATRRPTRRAVTDMGVV